MASEDKPTPPAKVKFRLNQRRNEKLGFEEVQIRERPRMVCTLCSNFLPYDEFEAGTDPLCKECRSKEAERELKEFKGKEFDKLSKSLVSVGVSQGTQPLEHIEGFLAELIHNFGGTKVFTKQWYEHLQRAMEDRPGSKMVLDHFRSIAKLVMDTNKLQHQESVADMSDQQLRDKKEIMMLSLLTEVAGDPGKRGLLVEMLRSTGMNIQEVREPIGIEYDNGSE